MFWKRVLSQKIYATQSTAQVAGVVKRQGGRDIYKVLLCIFFDLVKEVIIFGPTTIILKSDTKDKQVSQKIVDQLKELGYQAGIDKKKNLLIISSNNGQNQAHNLDDQTTYVGKKFSELTFDNWYEFKENYYGWTKKLLRKCCMPSKSTFV